MKKAQAILITLLLTLAFHQITLAQSSRAALNYDDVVFNKEFAVGFKLHTNGFGLSANYTKIHSIFKKTLYEFEIMDVRHPKEVRQQSIYSASIPNARRFAFGKENTFLNLNASIGRVKTIADKGKKSGVAVYWMYMGGASIGLVKPYHLDIIYEFFPGTNRDIRSEPYTEENANLFLDERFIDGASGFFTGIGKTKIQPGLQGKVALVFDWASYNEYVKALEFGAMLNVYAKRIPIMLTEDNQLFFANIYLKIMLGKRW